MIVSRTNLNVAEASDRDRFRVTISEEGSRLVCMSLFVLTVAVIITSLLLLLSCKFLLIFVFSLLLL